MLAGDDSKPETGFAGGSMAAVNLALPVFVSSFIYAMLILHPDTPLLFYAPAVLGVLYSVLLLLFVYNVRVTVSDGMLVVSRYWLWGLRVHRSWPLDEVNGIQKKTTKDRKRHLLVLALADGKLVSLQAITLRGCAVQRAQTRLQRSVNAVLMEAGHHPTVTDFTTSDHAATHDDKLFHASTSEREAVGPTIVPLSALSSVESMAHILEPADKRFVGDGGSSKATLRMGDRIASQKTLTSSVGEGMVEHSEGEEEVTDVEAAM